MRSLLGLVALFAFGCDSAPTDVTMTIGMQGGTVNSASGDGTSVAIPPGAVSTPAAITIRAVTVTPPAGTVLVGPAYDFGPQGTTFAQPVTITLPFDATKFPAGRTASDIRIYTAPSGTTNYQALQTTVVGKTVTTTTTHFTVYVPAVAAGSSGGMDMGPTGSCSPTCSASTGGCGCSATCNGHTYTLICSQETTTSPLSCFCEVDSATTTSASASQCSAIQGAFSQCLPN